MAGQVLATKLFLPRTDRYQVSRPRLLARLEPASESRISLVCAPAGFGKTRLVGEWLQQRAAARAWLSLDAGDNEAVPFFRHLLTALERAGVPLAQSTDLLSTAPNLPARDHMSCLINGLVAWDHPLTLVLDDFHFIKDAELAQAFQLLVDQLPPLLHLVLITRESPDLALSRPRVHRLLEEIGTGDLRFTVDEAAEFLNGRMELGLTPEQVESLAERTEGWIGALQLAALGLRDRRDDSGPVRFEGGNALVVEYLFDEVLARQPDEVRRFLVHTTVLDRFCPPLCDALIGGNGSRAMLRRLERLNLFLVPLDEEREWFRYHHLFAEMLRHRLKEHGDLIFSLHRRASRWFADQDMYEEAVRHSFLATDYEFAADLLEASDIAQLRLKAEGSSFLRWLEALPASILDRRPKLLLHLAALKVPGRDIASIDELLDRFESQDPEVPTESTSSLQPLAWGLRGITRFQAGDFTGALEQLTRAIEGSRGSGAPSVRFLRVALDIHLGASLAALGGVEEGREQIERGRAKALSTGSVVAFSYASAYLARLLLAQGELSQAFTLIAATLTELEPWNRNHFIVGHDPQTLLGSIHYERGDLAAARTEFERNLGPALREGNLENIANDLFGLALIELAAGDGSAARRRADEISSEAAKRPGTRAARLSGAHAAFVALRLGDIRRAEAWARRQSLPDDHALSMATTSEHLTLARVLDGMGSAEEARELLLRKVATAEAAGLLGDALTARVVLASCEQRSGMTGMALEHLAPALEIGQREGYLRTFLDEGEPMRVLLEGARRQGLAVEYVTQLLSSLPGGSPRSTDTRRVEALSHREREVLELIAGGLTNKQIAVRLAIEVATVKRHCANIYGKLAVGSRTQAVAKARELNLLRPAAPFGP